VLADEGGYFEFETIRPQSYGPPPHIHFIVSAEGFRTLRTEMQIDDGREVRRELTPALEERRAGERVWLEGTFDVVLEPAGAAGS
jgi:protocatechuate 3,4-dioxygenase beta subunit